ncbi:MAG: efflux RND transporter periplasmic adaptor subunit [Candidatus Moranbacteria bacterium]|nr:efflux RND transporter periplasmic adaptor subunit [Candidatus Moranbacteria bacterium]
MRDSFNKASVLKKLVLFYLVLIKFVVKKRKKNNLEDSSNNQDKKSKTKLLLFFVTVLIVLIIIFLLGREEDKKEEPKPVVKQVSAIDLDSDKTKFAKIRKTVKVDSKDQTAVFTLYSGRIVKDNFEIGQEVKKGEVLAVFDQSTLVNPNTVELKYAGESVEISKDALEAVEDQAEKIYKIAKNDVEVAKINLEQAEESGDKDAIKKAQERLEQAQRARDEAKARGESLEEQAEASLNQAEKGYAQALISQQNTIIKAPSSGIIISKNLSKNDYLNAGSMVAQISTSDNLESVVHLSKEEIQGIEIGDIVDVYCKNNDNIAHMAKVKNISSIPDSSNLRYALTIEYFKGLSDSSCLSANQFVEAQFNLPIEARQGTYFLPISAVKIGQNRNSVFVKQQDKARIKRVKLGRVYGDYVEIISGLENSDMVINKGSKNLSDGDLIEIIEEYEET